MPRRNLVVGTVVHAPEKALVAGEPLLPAHAVEQRREEKAVPVGIERNGIDVTRLGIADNLPIARIVDRAAAAVDGVVTVQVLEAHVARIGDVLLAAACFRGLPVHLQSGSGLLLRYLSVPKLQDLKVQRFFRQIRSVW